MAESIGNRDLQAHIVNHLQSFELNPEIYNLISASGMELIGLSSKNPNQESSSVFWKGCSNKPGNHVGSSWKGIDGPGSSSESAYKHGLTGITDSNSMVSQENSFVDFSSLRSVFPERPSKGLSLSLNPSNPSSIGLQSFELVQETDLRFDPSSSRPVTNINPQHHYMMQENSHEFGKYSKFLGHTQELLNEFCNLGTSKTHDSSKQKIQKTSERQDEIPMSKQSLQALDHLELQNRTTKLLQMLEEVDRRYKHYCDQMKAVVSSFEAVAGNGAATVYSALASRAMSKHFRCLKDGILSQMKATEKAMGDKDCAVTGTSKGETPRLRLLDQALRQQRAFQQTRMMENHPWRPQRGLPERSVSVLRAWLFEHFLHPYPNDIDKHTLARQTGLSRSQVSNWFINARVRLWKPMVEEMYLEEFKDHHDGVRFGADRNDEFLNQNLSSNEDQKPTHDQLVRIHSESPSSILNINPEKNGGKRNKTLENEAKNHCFGGVGDSSFGAIELDFSSYPYHSAASGGGITPTVSYGGGGGVSLTLGLYHQHGLQAGSLFYPRSYDHMEDCHERVQYSILEGENHNYIYPTAGI